MAKKNTIDPSDGSAVWRERWSLARTNQDRMFKRFADWYDSLYAQIGKLPSPWRSKVYVPILARQTWALISKFLTLKPGFQVSVQDPELEDEQLEEKAEKAQRKLEYDYNNSFFEESIRDKLTHTLMDAVVTGTGLAKVPWTVKKCDYYQKLKDPNGGGVDLGKYKVKSVIEGFNDLKPINIFNVFVSPAAKNLYNAPWIIIKEYKPISELEDVNEAEGAVIYHNLNQLNGKVTYDTYAAYDRSRNRLLTNADPTDKTVKMVALYECYEKDMIYTYAESGGQDSDQGWILLRKQKNPYWHGKYPLVKFHVKKKPFQFWGEGIFETTFRLQSAYNDAVNHYFDAWNVSVDPMLIVPESANVNDYIIEPAGMITYRGQQAPEAFKHQAPDPRMLQTATDLLDRAIEGVTISQYASGIPNSESDKTKGTATGIMRLQEASGDVISFFKENFAQGILQIGKMWLSNNQQFLLRPVNVTINTPQGPQTTKVTPEDFQYDMELRIDEASMEPMNDDQKVKNDMAYTNQLLAFQNQSFQQAQVAGTQPLVLDFTTLSEELSDDFKKRSFGKVVVPPEQVQQAHQQQLQQAMQHVQAAGGAQQAQQGEGQKPKSLYESLQMKFSDFPEDVKQELIKQIFGIQSQTPSPIEQQNMLKAMDTVSKSAQAGNKIHAQNIDSANTMVQSAHQMAMAQQPNVSGGESGRPTGSETPAVS